jgi:hypothetical protein
MRVLDRVKTRRLDDLIEEESKVSYEMFLPIKVDERYVGVDLKYIVNPEEQNLEISLKEQNKDLLIGVDKHNKENSAYSISLRYDTGRKGYVVRYEAEYGGRIDIARQDFTNRLDKALEILPKSLMGGILGFTYLGSGKMTRRADLFGDMALMVDVHEAIHTPDEYETRVLTSWILRMEKPKYKR